MRIPRIYCKKKLSSNESFVLDDDAAHHLSKVLRMQTGRSLILFDGRGSEFLAELVEVSKKQVTAKTGSENPISRESPLASELAIGISRGDRMDWIIQKATELGITRIAPLFTERTEVKLSRERLEKRHTQWQKIAIAACEQCQRNVIPEILLPQTIDQYLSSTKAELKYVLHHRSQAKLDRSLTPDSVAILVGPEGGLSEAEIAESSNRGFTPLTLGPRVMRTETAPLAALSLMQHNWGDLS